MDSLQGEVWKDIPGYPGFKASSLGRIVRLSRQSRDKSHKKGRGGETKERILKTAICKGYLRVTMCNRNQSVHRIIALAFHGAPNERMTVNHIDGNKQNNAASNLEWLTHADNVKHSLQSGLVPRRGGRSCKLNEKKVRFIRMGLMSIAELSRLYGVREETVVRVRSRKYYKNVI